MSSEQPTKKQIIFGRQRQTRLASRLRDLFGPSEYSGSAVEAALSLALESQSRACAIRNRETGEARVRRFETVDDALLWLQQRNILGTGRCVASFVIIGEEPSGFFLGTPGHASLADVLGASLESITILHGGQHKLVCVDCVEDDPVWGRFIEVEEMPLCETLQISLATVFAPPS